MTRTALSSIAALVALALLAGCTGGLQGSSSAIPGSGLTSTERSYSDLARTGISPRYFSLMRLERRTAVPNTYHGLRDLYIDDVGLGSPYGEVVLFRNGTYTKKTDITTGINGPDGNFIDKPGNLYVANYAAVDIAEYAPRAKSPSFVYSAGMKDPVDVAVDASGNVYEDDYNSGGAGFVKEYSQAQNLTRHTCTLGSPAEGVGVDSKGDVFVSYNVASGGGIIEYKGGLKGCHATVLGVSLLFAGGLAVDAKNNLIVCDQDAPAVYVIDPPYTKVKKKIGSGYTDPFHVAINKANTDVFIVDPGNVAVYVYTYPLGHIVTTLGSTDGLVDPFGAVDSPNAVY